MIFYFAYLFRIGALVGWIGAWSGPFNSVSPIIITHHHHLITPSRPSRTTGILVEAVLVVTLVIGKFYLENVYIKRHPELQRPPVKAADSDQVGSKDVDDMELQRSSLTPHAQPRDASSSWLPHHPHMVNARPSEDT